MPKLFINKYGVKRNTKIFNKCTLLYVDMWNQGFQSMLVYICRVSVTPVPPNADSRGVCTSDSNGHRWHNFPKRGTTLGEICQQIKRQSSFTHTLGALLGKHRSTQILCDEAFLWKLVSSQTLIVVNVFLGFVFLFCFVLFFSCFVLFCFVST